MENKKTNTAMAIMLVLTMGSVHTQADTCHKKKACAWGTSSCKANKASVCAKRYARLNLNPCAQNACAQNACAQNTWSQNNVSSDGNQWKIEHAIAKLKHKIKKLWKHINALELLSNMQIDKSNIEKATTIYKKIQELQALLNKVGEKFAKKLADFGTNMPESKTLATKKPHHLKKFAAAAKRKLAAKKKVLAAKKNSKSPVTAAQTPVITAAETPVLTAAETPVLTAAQTPVLTAATTPVLTAATTPVTRA